MEKACIITGSGCQVYLYNISIVYHGKTILSREDLLFGDLISILSDILISPSQPMALSDVEFASHLLNIANDGDYSFTVDASLVEDYV